jgi:hypothetical protein
VTPRVLILTIILSHAAVASGDALLVKESGDVKLHYHSLDAWKLEQALTAVQEVRQDIRDKLGIEFRYPVDIVLARGREEFEEWAGEGIPGWALAIAHTKRRGIVVDVARTGPLLDNNLLLTLRHEVCHLALGQVEKESGRELPLWFHEGVAVRLTGMRHFANRDTFEVAAAHRKLLPLAQLEQRFPADAQAAELAYQESESFVNFLTARCRDSLAALIAELKKGSEFAQAVQRVSGASLAELERQWHDSFRSSHPWILTLWKALSLFAVLAFCTVVVYFIGRLRNRRRIRDWKKEERTVAAADEDYGDEGERHHEDEDEYEG